MTTYAERPTIAATPRVVPASKGKNFVKWVTSTDHKTIGYLYLMTSFAWFLIGGILDVAATDPAKTDSGHVQFLVRRDRAGGGIQPGAGHCESGGGHTGVTKERSTVELGCHGVG